MGVEGTLSCCEDMGARALAGVDGIDMLEPSPEDMLLLMGGTGAEATRDMALPPKSFWELELSECESLW